MPSEEEPTESDNIENETPPELESSEDEEEDAEEVKASAKCDCYKHQSINSVGTEGENITKESVKLTPKQVDKLLKENYIKSQQHRFRVEEKYRFF